MDRGETQREEGSIGDRDTDRGRMGRDRERESGERQRKGEWGEKKREGETEKRRGGDRDRETMTGIQW